jgi:hypothetical protein
MFNAVIKGAMAVASVTMYETNRTITQVITISISLVLHILVRPYKSTTENVVVVLFCIVELLGINASTSAFWQILFIVASFLMLIFVSAMAFKVTRASIKEKKKNGLLNDENQYTPLEKKLLLPVFLCVWPLKRMAVLLCRLNKDVKQEEVEMTSTKINNTKVLPVSSRCSLNIQIIDGPHKGQVIKDYALTNAFQISIGYDEECDILLDQDEDISGTHASICWNWDDDNVLTFDDQESTNGSKVNGVSVHAGETIELSSNDKIEVGESVLVVVIKNQSTDMNASEKTYNEPQSVKDGGGGNAGGKEDNCINVSGDVSSDENDGRSIKKKKKHHHHHHHHKSKKDKTKVVPIQQEE